jgi:predicted phosphodiesterase
MDEVMLILHLSDIHFRKSEISTVQDPNFHLRNELVRDVETQCEQLGAPDVIIVSGDITFAGDPLEFAYAAEWLAKLCKSSGCSLESVFVVPGNHDVVRRQADRYLVQIVHNAIKESGNPNKEIARQMSDPDAHRLLYESLDNYNEFALQFFCDLLPPERTRAQRDLKLNDGSTLRLWGLNSTFVSSSKDKLGDLFVDPASMQITREKGVVNLVVTHHHLSWLRQRRELEDHLNDVAPLQIFGHVHTNRIERNTEYLRLTASAANPERSELNFEPGYNFIELEVNREGEGRALVTKSHVRIWRTAPGEFYPKMNRSSLFFEHSIALENWTPPCDKAPSPISITEKEIMPTEDGEVTISLRDLGLRFYRLSFSKKSEIVGRLELFEEEDIHLPDFERFRRVFFRASERGNFNELATAVIAAEKG